PGELRRHRGLRFRARHRGDVQGDRGRADGAARHAGSEGLMKSPSTDWKEVVAPDEDERFERYGREFAEFQRRITARSGNGRALHRRQLLAMHGTLDVLAG